MIVCTPVDGPGPGRISRRHSGHSGVQKTRGIRSSAAPTTTLIRSPSAQLAAGAGTSNARTLLLHSTEQSTQRRTLTQLLRLGWLCDHRPFPFVTLLHPVGEQCPAVPNKQPTLVHVSANVAVTSYRRMENLPAGRLAKQQLRLGGAHRKSQRSLRDRVAAERATTSSARALCVLAWNTYARRPVQSFSATGTTAVSAPWTWPDNYGIGSCDGLARRRGQSPHGLLSPRPADREKTHKVLCAR